MFMNQHDMNRSIDAMRGEKSQNNTAKTLLPENKLINICDKLTKLEKVLLRKDHKVCNTH